MWLFIGLVAAVGVGLLAWSESDDDSAGMREIWLVTGSQYSLLIAEPNVTDFSQLEGMLASMGFTVLDIQLQPPGGLFQVLVRWDNQNTLWQVPENVSVGEV